MSEITIIYKDINESRFSNMLYAFGIITMTTAIYEWVIEDSIDPYDFPEVKNTLMRLLIHASVCMDGALFRSTCFIGDAFYADPSYLKMLDVYKSITGNNIVELNTKDTTTDDLILLIENLKNDAAVIEDDRDDALNSDMMYLLINAANDIIIKEINYPKITRQ